MEDKDNVFDFTILLHTQIYDPESSRKFLKEFINEHENFLLLSKESQLQYWSELLNKSKTHEETEDFINRHINQC